MKYLNKIICFVGILVVFSTCDSKLPFPDTEKVTFIVIENLNDFPFLTSISDPNMDIKLGVRLQKFGGTEYSKIEICAVRNPGTNNYQTAVLTEITSGLSVENSIVHTFKLGDIISKTGGGSSLEGGDQLGLYYNLEMPDGRKTFGWTKPTGFTGVHVDAIGDQTSFFRINVVCGFNYSDLLGEWSWSDSWIEDEWIVVATDDPDSPGAGLIFTFDEEGIEGEPPADYPMKMGIDITTYKFTFAARQRFWDSLAHWGMSQYFLELNGGAGDIGTCGTITISFTPSFYYAIGNSGWNNNAGPIVIKKLP